MNEAIVDLLQQIFRELQRTTPSNDAAPANSKWMSEEELSALTGLSVKRLQNLRAERRVFPFFNPAGTRVNVYDRAEIDKILEESRVSVRTSTVKP